MQKVKSIMAIAATMALCAAAMAQNKQPLQFNNQQLPEQLQQWLDQGTSDNERKSLNAKLVKQFEPVYSSMDLDMRDRLVEMVYTLQKLRAKPLPEVYDFIETMNIMALSDGGANFGQWFAITEYLIGKSKSLKDFNAFVDFTAKLLSDNLLCAAKGSKWRVAAGTPYKMRLEGKDIIVSFDRPFNLTYASDRDENVLLGTTGQFWFFDAKWKGHGGTLTWERTGLDAKVCKAQLNNYEAILKFPKFTADSVLFTNTNYFPQPIYGHLEEQLAGKQEPEKYTFPKFQSYQKNFKLKEIAPGVDYSGGFMMNGAKFITSDQKNPATLIFYRAGKPFVKVNSPKFTITTKRIVSENASVRIMLDADSVYNKGITVRYIVDEAKVYFINNLKRNYYSPYNNTYHCLDMHCESMTWDMRGDILEMSMLNEGGGQSSATFESQDYYSDVKFRQIQGIDQVSPVIRVYQYMKSRGMAYDFYVDELAGHVHMDVIQAKSMIHTLAHSGLVSFDQNSGLVTVHDKLVSYAKAYSKSKDNDYDAITLESNVKGANARLSLADNKLAVHGVKKFVVSDSQHVVIYPKDGNVVIGKNRDISFDGRIDAGKFFMFVSGARFIYDQFKLDMPTVDSLYFYVTKFDNPQKDHIVYTPLFNLTGNILVDKPDNHSGLKKNKGYPILNSLKDSYVYYDKRDIYGGAYKRDKFYYTLKPFVINDMLKFVTDSLYFNGALTSAGIFPVIEEPLRVQRDYSLGFVRNTPSQGLPAYGGKGTYKNTMDLSYKGFRGQGAVDYLSAHIDSKQIVFLPDSMLSVSDTFYVVEDATYPDIHNGRCFQRWYPYRDSMRISMVREGKPFSLYRNEVTLTGNTTIMPGAAYASGTAEMGDGTLTSRRMHLHSRDLATRRCSFAVNSPRYNALAFAASGVKAEVDFDKHRGEFSTDMGLAGAVSLVPADLPLVNYKAYIDRFNWQMDRKIIDLRNSQNSATGGLESMDIQHRADQASMPGVRLVSTEPTRDSLAFCSVEPSYRYDEPSLSCAKTFMLNVADAAIVPGGDSVRISSSGAMDLIHNATILASRDSKYHLFQRGEALVSSSRSYAAKGLYAYVDEEQRQYPIRFDTIAPDSKGRTVATAFISDDADFHLSAAFAYAGRVTAYADEMFLFFDGGLRLMHNCAPQADKALLSFKGFVDPEHISVEVPAIPTDWKGNPISAAILFNRTTDLMPYHAFLTNNRVADNALLTASGRLAWLKDSKKYIIASQDKIDDFDNTYAPYLLLDTRTCMATGEGPLSFNQSELYLKMLQYGTVQTDGRDHSKTVINSVFGVTFPIDDKVRDVMAQYIADDLRLSPVSDENELLRSACRYYMGAEDGNLAYLTYRMNGYFGKVPQQLFSTILFENVQWHYSNVLGYYHDGPVVLSSIGAKELHLQVQAKMQLHRRGTATYLTVYLQAAPDHWYYFNYEFSSRQMVIQSSVGEWVDMIKSLSAEKRHVDGPDNGYTYRISTSRNEVPNFIARFSGGSSTSDEE